MKDFGMGNRRIRTGLTGEHHAFELREVRQATQPVTGIVLTIVDMRGAKSIRH